MLSTRDRASDYQAVTPDITAHPLFGRGYKSFDPLTYRILDNEYLGLLVGVGFVGLLSYLLLLPSRSLLRTGWPAVGPRPGAARRRCRVRDCGRRRLDGLFDLLSFPHIPYAFFFVVALVVASRRPRCVPEPDQIDERGRSVRTRFTRSGRLTENCNAA